MKAKNVRMTGGGKQNSFSLSLGDQTEENVKLVELKLDLKKNLQSTKFAVEILYRRPTKTKPKSLSYICPSRIDDNVGSSSLRPM